MTGPLPSRFIPRRGPLIALGLLVVALLAAVTLSALPVDGSAQAQEAEPTGRLVLVPDDLWVGETTEVIGFHLEFPDKSITVEYSEHFVPTGETCEDAEAGSASFASSPARIALTACAVGEGRVQLKEANTDNVVAEATAAITEPEAAVTGEQQGCIDPNTFGPCTPDAPSGLDALVLGQRDIAVTWNRLNGATMYRLAHQPEGGSVKTSIVNGTGKSFVVDKGSTHRFRVQAFGNGSTWKAEWGSWSEWVEVTTDSPPTITITRDSSPITEGPNKSARFTLHADPAFSFSSLTINISVTERGNFLRSSPTTVHLGRNRATASLTLPIHNDSVCENHGSVTVRIRPSTGHQGYIVGSPSSASVTIRDDDGGPNCREPDLPEISVSALSESVVEDRPARFKITANPAPAGNLTVNIDVSQTGDFLSGSAPSTVTISGGSSSYTLNLPTTGDQICENHGSVTVTARSGTGYVLSNSYSDSMTITDDDGGPNCGDLPEISVSALNESVVEDRPAGFRITANPAPATNLSVNIDVTQTGDFLSDSAPSTVTISGGSSSYTLNLPTTGDQICENHGSVTVTARSGTGYVLSNSYSDSMTITDDDGGPDCDGPEPITVMFGSDSYRVTEGSRRSITVNLSRSPGKNVDIPVTVSPGSNVTVSFGGSQKSRTFPYTAPQDSDCDDETVNLSFGDLPAGIVRGTPDTSRISITDNDTCRPVITVTSLDDSPVTEGASATFRIWANPAPRFNLSVNIDVTQTEDYLSGSTPSTATIPGSRYSDLSLPTEDDMVYEAHGSVRVEILQGSGYTVGGSSTATVEVMDNDPQQPQMLPSTTGDGTITLTWEWHDDVRATSYLVQQWFGEGSDPRFRTLPFDEYTISFSGTDKTRSATIEGLTNATSYTHRVISVNSAGQSPPTQIDTHLPLAAPTNLDVSPMTQRRAKLTWGSAPNASGYTIKVINPRGGHGTVRTSETSNVIHLDNILGSDGLSEQDYFEFQIMANHSTVTQFDSVFSKTVRVIDTPITRVSGLSATARVGTDEGTAMVRAPIAGVVGGNYDYSEAEVVFRFRKRGSTEYSEETLKYSGRGEYEIDDLTTGTVYGIQFTLIPLEGSDKSFKVFGGRESYVWVSGNGVFEGGLADVHDYFLFYGFWQPGKDQIIEYRYSICDNTFPSEHSDGTKISDWAILIQQAFGQWNIASDRLVQMTLDSVYKGSENSVCDRANEKPLDIINSSGTEVFAMNATNFHHEFPGDPLPSCEEKDIACVVPLRKSAGGIPLVFTKGMKELINEIGQEAFSPSMPVIANGDVVINKRIVHEGAIQPHIPGSDKTVGPDDVRFNTCMKGFGDTDFKFYEAMVHEAGHALGIYTARRMDSVMNHSNHPPNEDEWTNCFPQPLDVMAVYAIYQTIGPSE